MGLGERSRKELLRTSTKRILSTVIESARCAVFRALNLDYDEMIRVVELMLC